MKHAIYHTELDTFVYEYQADFDPNTFDEERTDRELRFLFCVFITKCEGPLINIYNGDLDHLLMCDLVNAYHHIDSNETLRTVHNNSLSTDHKKLYEYLVEIGLEHIRFVPWTEDKKLNWKRSFPLTEWSY